MAESLAFRALLAIIATLLGVGALTPAKSPESGQYGAVTTTVAPPPTYRPVVPTTVGPQATVVGCQGALDLAVKVGWPLDQMGTLATVLWRESRCTNQYPDGRLVHNPGDPKGGSWCMMQLNGAHFERTAWAPRGWMGEQGIGVMYPADLRNAELCLRAGLALYRFAERVYGDGWQPWTATRG